MTVLYDYWRSSASYRVRIALEMAGIKWQSVSVNLLDGDQTAPSHLARNPQGLVPALEIDGEVLTQSLAIVEYLNETRSLGLLPAAPAERAKTRAVAHAVCMDIHPVCNLRVVGYAAENSEGRISKEAWMHHFITLGLAHVEEMIDGGDYCLGTGVTLADICLVPQVYNAYRWGVDMTALPKIARVAAHLDTLPAFRAATPENTPH